MDEYFNTTKSLLKVEAHNWRMSALNGDTDISSYGKIHFIVPKQTVNYQNLIRIKFERNGTA